MNNCIWDHPPEILRQKIKEYKDYYERMDWELNGYVLDQINSMQWQIDNPIEWQKVQDNLPCSPYNSKNKRNWVSKVKIVTVYDESKWICGGWLNPEIGTLYYEDENAKEPFAFQELIYDEVNNTYKRGKFIKYE